jgi:hypothetical protein
MKTANLKLRLKALFIDYLIILAYLLILTIVTLGIYFLVLQEIPELTENQSHWIAFLTTTLPVMLYFSYREAKAPYATIGKQRYGLRVKYSKHPVLSSLIRNALKFLPWHLGHYSVIKGIYAERFTSLDVLIPYALAIFLPILYIGMVWRRADHRHLPDILAHDHVIINKH